MAGRKPKTGGSDGKNGQKANAFFPYRLISFHKNSSLWKSLYYSLLNKEEKCVCFLLINNLHRVRLGTGIGSGGKFLYCGGDVFSFTDILEHIPPGGAGFSPAGGNLIIIAQKLCKVAVFMHYFVMGIDIFYFPYRKLGGSMNRCCVLSVSYTQR